MTLNVAGCYEKCYMFQLVLYLNASVIIDSHHLATLRNPPYAELIGTGRGREEGKKKEGGEKSS